VTRGIEAQVANHRLGHRLEVVVQQRQDPETRRQDEQTLGGLEGGHCSEAGKRLAMANRTQPKLRGAQVGGLPIEDSHPRTP
jgi:hypothetical protein